MKPRLKILHVVFSLEPGGMENGIVNVARALPAEEFEIHVACLVRPGQFAERLPQPENVYALGRTSGFSLRTVFALREVIRRVRPDVMHTHNLGPLIYGALADGLGATCPILHGEHAELTPEEHSPRRMMQRRLLYRCCRKIHTVSHTLTRQLVDLGFPKEKIETIVNGVDTVRFAPEDRSGAKQELGFDNSSFIVGMVGRFGSFKRHALLIDAFERLASSYPHLQLLMVGGGGPEEGRIRERAQQSPLAPRIHLAGYQYDPRPYYHAMDLLVAPSVNEGLSNAVLEAMSCGVPVLAHEACGNSEAIEDGRTGFLADLGTVEKLEEKLAGMINKPGVTDSLGAQARRKTEESFSLDSMANGYGHLYREIAR